MIYAVGKTNPHNRYGYADFRIAEDLFERVEKGYVHGKFSALFRVPFELCAKKY